MKHETLIRVSAMAPSDGFSERENAAAARQIGFAQCVTALQRTLATTPAGWLLVAWMCWGLVPQFRLVTWVSCFAVIWVTSVWWLKRVARRGSRIQDHAGGVIVIAALDGAAWGSAVGLLMGFDRVLDPWLAAVLCGVSAVNAPVYITYVRAYRVQLAGLWLAIVAGALSAMNAHPAPLEGVIGLSMFLGLLVSYMNPIAQRVVEGIVLQLNNAQLAQQLRGALELVERDATTDALTGLPNRRALDVQLEREIKTAKRSGRPLSLLLLDIDHFKSVNDAHGHGVGDEVLREFAHRVRRLLRQTEICARYGGEEFAVLLPDTILSSALGVAERIRSAVAEGPLVPSRQISLTVSIGAAQWSPDQGPVALLEAADVAAYSAKRNGRNQVRPPPVASGLQEYGA